MSDAQDEAASVAARSLASRRWGSTKVDRAAALVIKRHGELDEALRAQLHEVTEAPGGESRGDG